ncbi:MAG: DNA polymerase IV [Anaerosomatales bacterium]|nr:DNA polymerase IV [Anaerosomatales bacterium]
MAAEQAKGQSSGAKAWSGRAVLHVDMDAFFAAVEQLDDPALRGRPVIVGGSPDSRGVVSTASYEARVFGVRSAMPSATAARLCPGAVWLRPRFERYAEVARAVREIFSSVTPLVENASIDEAYLDVTPGESGEHPAAVARRIQDAVGRMGLSCSIGVATSKCVAKIASDQEKPGGLVVVEPGTEAAFLAPLPVGALGGIGPAAQKRLARFGVTTLGELAELDPAVAREALGAFGPVAVQRARGVDPRPVVVERTVKSVSNEVTFEHDLTRDEAESRLSGLVEKVASRLRARGLACRTLTVKVRFADMTTRSVQATVEQPTDLGRDMLPIAVELFRKVAVAGPRIRLLGFGASGLCEPAVQMGLFGDDASEAARVREQSLARNLDEIRSRFGPAAVQRGFKPKRPKR